MGEGAISERNVGKAGGVDDEHGPVAHVDFATGRESLVESDPFGGLNFLRWGLKHSCLERNIAQQVSGSKERRVRDDHRNHKASTRQSAAWRVLPTEVIRERVGRVYQ